jgi:hypothetical protein
MITEAKDLRPYHAAHMTMRRTCWASLAPELGPCDGLSKEHIVSKSVLLKSRPDSPLLIEGHSRIRDGTIGVNALTANILCRRHNSALSEIDATAASLVEWLNARAPERNTELRANGPRLERWLLKTVVNHLASEQASPSGNHVERLMVENVYGLEPMPPDCGMYLLNASHSTKGRRFEFAYSPIWGNLPNGDLQIQMAFISLNGLTLAFSFRDQPSEFLQRHGYALNDRPIAGGDMIFRPESIVELSDRGDAYTLHLEW